MFNKLLEIFQTNMSIINHFTIKYKIHDVVTVAVAAEFHHVHDVPQRHRFSSLFSIPAVWFTTTRTGHVSGIY